MKNVFSSFEAFVLPESLGSGCVMASLRACTETDEEVVESELNRG